MVVVVASFAYFFKLESLTALHIRFTRESGSSILILFEQLPFPKDAVHFHFS